MKINSCSSDSLKILFLSLIHIFSGAVLALDRLCRKSNYLFAETSHGNDLYIDVYKRQTSALDPISTSKIEELAMELKKDYTIVMVTHNMQQATRISDKTAFFLPVSYTHLDVYKRQSTHWKSRNLPKWQTAVLYFMKGRL